MKQIIKSSIYYLTILIALLPITGPGHTNAQDVLEIKDLKGKWMILGEESEFIFRARTFGLFTVKGTIGGIKGNIDFDNINTSRFISLSLKPSILNTGNEKRDEHLRSEDFLYVDEYPLIEFNGGAVELKNQEEQSYEVTGELTIRGVTHKEIIPATLTGYYNPQKTKIEFTGSLEIDRNKYEVDYTGRLIADDVKIEYTLIAEKNN